MAFKTAIYSRILLTINVILIVFQIIIVSVLWEMLDSIDDPINVSQSMFPDSDVLFNSHYVDWIVSPFFAVAMTLIIVISIAKEFWYSDRLRRIIINIVLVIAMSSSVGFVAKIVFSPAEVIT